MVLTPSEKVQVLETIEGDMHDLVHNEQDNTKISTCLVKLRQKPKESLSSFMDRFNKETCLITNLNHAITLYLLVSGLKI